MSLQTSQLTFDIPLMPVKILSAGSLKCMYENGNLRYISLEGSEVVRMIYSAVRDDNWQTAPYEIHDELVEEHEAGFSIKYTAIYLLNEIRYKAFFEIEGMDNTISFSMKGVALNHFQTNRIGICIHHPIGECAGKKVLIKQPDGNSYESVFPEMISAHQPFKEIQQMRWTNRAGVQAESTFAGDVFETEDQRNWADASYKTYSRPLDLPFPYAVHEGETIEQRVTLKVTENNNAGRQSHADHLNAGEIKMHFPDMGYCRRKGFRHLTDTEISLLQKVPFNHYRVELHLIEKDWKNEFATALSEAKKVDTRLELIVFFGSEIANDLKELVEQLQGRQQYIKSILVLHQEQHVTPHELFLDVRDVLKNDLPDVKTGYGTDGYFAALNRNKPQTADYDFVSYSLNPQVHAADTRTVIENLSAQPDTIHTVQTFAPGKAIYVSPVTFKKRDDHGKDVDERLHTSFGAWWTLQCIKNLSGANSITFYETVGAMGIIKEKEFSAGEDLLTPVYEVLAAIYAFQPVYLIIQDAEKNSFVMENSSGERSAISVIK